MIHLTTDPGAAGPSTTTCRSHSADRGDPADRLPVRFLFTPAVTEQDALETMRLFFQELLDQELREQVGDETRALRALIVAQAFSRTGLIRQD